MKQIPLLVAAVLVAAVADAGTLLPGGDFTDARKDLRPLVFSNGGKVSLFQEESTWNNCGRLEVVDARTNEHGVVTMNAVALIGSDGKASGVSVEGGKTYDFSIEVRGTAPKASLAACVWTDSPWKAKRIDANVGRIAVCESWTFYKGSFKVPDGYTRAAVRLQIWDSAKDGKPDVRVGDAVYFDNVKIEESTENLLRLKTPKMEIRKVDSVKSIAAGSCFDDFLRYERGAGARGDANGAPKVCFTVEDSAVVFDVRVGCGDNRGDKGSPWSGNCLELFFGPAEESADREFTQLAWNPSGAKFTRAGVAGRDEDWSVVRNEMKGGVWGCRVRVPCLVLGFKAPPRYGMMVPFNVTFTPKGKGAYPMSWAPVRGGFTDVGHYGRLVFGTFRDALKLRFGQDEEIAKREEFERRMAELETEALKVEQDAFLERAFTVSVLPVDNDYSVPFVPKESFHPVKTISIKAAVNERVGLPVAIFNATDRAEEYVVRIETNTADPANPCAEKQLNGKWGLAGFPAERVVAREALRFKDAESDPISLRLDPLPRMNEACTIQIPPKESGVAWFDFDTTDVEPGCYVGRLRVIPLGQKSSWKASGGYHKRAYVGKMQDIPVELEVRPIVLSKEPAMPSAFFQNATSESQFDLMYQIGTRDFQVSPWNFGVDGNERKIEEEGASVRRMKGWADSRGCQVTFFVGFNVFNVFADNLCGKKGNALERWPDYLKCVKGSMNRWGVPDSDYVIEVYDEPKPDKFEEVKKVLSAAKSVYPQIRLAITLGAHILPADRMRELDPFVDVWILWQHGYFKDAGHLSYVREALDAGKAVWHYTCSESGRVPIYGTYRLHPWFGWRHGLTGNQFFIFQTMTGGYGPADFKTAMSSGIAYRSFETTMPSLRYMSMRRGVEDVKYLAKLKAVAGNEPEVKAFLDDAPVRVVETERHDKTTPDRMRERAAELILKYEKRR